MTNLPTRMAVPLGAVSVVSFWVCTLGCVGTDSWLAIEDPIFCNAVIDRRQQEDDQQEQDRQGGGIAIERCLAEDGKNQHAGSISCPQCSGRTHHKDMIKGFEGANR